MQLFQNLKKQIQLNKLQNQSIKKNFENKNKIYIIQ